MDNWEKYAVVKNLKDLVQSVTVNNLVNGMLSCFGINPDDCQRIMHEATEGDKMRTLLLILLKKSDRNENIFPTLLQELRNSLCGEIADQLEESYKKAKDTPEMSDEGAKCTDFYKFVKTVRSTDNSILQDVPMYMNVENLYVINGMEGWTFQGIPRNLSEILPQNVARKMNNSPEKEHTGMRMFVDASSDKDLGGHYKPPWAMQTTDPNLRTKVPIDRNLQNELVKAVNDEDYDKVCNLVNKGADFYERDMSNQSVFMHAVEKGAFCTFICAVIAGDVEVVKWMLRCGVGVNDCSWSGRTPLMYASLLGRTDVAELLLARGATVNAINRGSTALIYASYSGKEDMIKLLMKYEAEINVPDVNNTALMIAVYFKKDETTEFLLNNHADVNAVNTNSYTALLLAAERGVPHIVKMLLDHGADINATDMLGSTSLMKASQAGDITTVKILLKYKANIEIRDDFSFSALSWAARHGKMDVLLALLEMNPRISVDVVTTAINAGHTEIVEKLLDYGSPIATVDGNLQSPIVEAVRSNNFEIAELMLSRSGSRGNEKEAIVWAARNGNKEILMLLMEYHVDLNYRDKNGYTGLMWAALKNYSEITVILASNGANVDDQDRNGNSALMLAAAKNHANIVAILSAHGANINECDESGQTALMIAAKKNFEGTVRVLIDRQADIDVKDKSRKSALILAAINNHQTTVMALLKAGAYVNACDISGRTALSYSASQGYKLIIDILIAHPEIDVTIPDVEGKTALHYAKINSRNSREIERKIKPKKPRRCCQII